MHDLLNSFFFALSDPEPLDVSGSSSQGAMALAAGGSPFNPSILSGGSSGGVSRGSVRHRDDVTGMRRELLRPSSKNAAVAQWACQSGDNNAAKRHAPDHLTYHTWVYR